MHENLATILSTLIDKGTVSETEICHQTKLPRSTIYRLKEGLVDPRLSTLQALAKFFKISIDQLTGEKEIPLYNNGNQTKLVKIPTHSWDTFWLTNTNESNPETSDYIDFQISNNDNIKNYFSLRVFSDAMSPVFPPNSILIINKNRIAKNQDYVIAASEHNNDLIFRRLLLEGETKLLQATNPAFPTTALSDAKNIIGVVVESRKSF